MKVLHLNAKDIQGGAARAAYRLHSTLQEEIDSSMLVRQKHSDKEEIQSMSSIFSTQISKFRRGIDSLPFRRYRDRSETYFSTCAIPDQVNKKIQKIDPDIVHLHWVGGGYMRIESIGKINYPTVWTLHDMWAFTGGCHYSGDCEKYTRSCGECPVLGSNDREDLSRKVWERKNSSWESFDPTVVTPSYWLTECAKSSSILGDETVRTIPNTIPVSKYQPKPRKESRQMFDISRDKHVFLYGAMDATSDPRKGYRYIEDLMDQIPSDKAKNIEFVVFGSEESRTTVEHGIPVNYLGYVSDSQLPALYSSADAMIVPSRQDNFPNTILESLACGTPCIAFDVGGIPDMIKHEQTGYLAEPYETDGLLSGIEWVVQEKEDHELVEERCRRFVLNNCSPDVVRRQYLSLYSEITDPS